MNNYSWLWQLWALDILHLRPTETPPDHHERGQVLGVRPYSMNSNIPLNHNIAEGLQWLRNVFTILKSSVMALLFTVFVIIYISSISMFFEDILTLFFSICRGYIDVSDYSKGIPGRQKRWGDRFPSSKIGLRGRRVRFRHPRHIGQSSWFRSAENNGNFRHPLHCSWSSRVYSYLRLVLEVLPERVKTNDPHTELFYFRQASGLPARRFGLFRSVGSRIRRRGRLIVPPTS